MKFIIQDLPTVIEDAKKVCQPYGLMESLTLFELFYQFWADSMPQALQSGRVVLQSEHEIQNELGFPEYWTPFVLVSSSKRLFQGPTNQRRRYLLHAHDFARLGR